MGSTLVAWNGYGVYNLTKFGVNGFTESPRQEVIRRHVRVGALEPGGVETELGSHNTSEIRGRMIDPFYGQTQVLAPEDIADGVVYMVTRPRHASVSELWIMPTDQAWPKAYGKGDDADRRRVSAERARRGSHLGPGVRPPRLTGSFSERDPFHDPLVMFAHLAGVTERLGFATGVLILPQRQTALVARQAADVDLLAGGRLPLGVGIGWNHVEYQALGQDFHTRGARQEEQIGLLRRLFTEPVVDFSGRFDRIDRAALVPKPALPVPIRLGGSGDAAFDRAARLADGFIFFSADSGSTVSAWNRLRERVRVLDRPVAAFGADWVLLPHRVGAVTDEIDTWR